VTLTLAETPAELVPYASWGWALEAFPGGLAVYSAERREGNGSLRYIVARTPAELAAKLAVIEAEDAKAGTS
jgi:hypothetical protein